MSRRFFFVTVVIDYFFCSQFESRYDNSLLKYICLAAIDVWAESAAVWARLIWAKARAIAR